MANLDIYPYVFVKPGPLFTDNIQTNNKPFQHNKTTTTKQTNKF